MYPYIFGNMLHLTCTLIYTFGLCMYITINRTKFRIIFQTFPMEPNGGHLKRLAPRWSARPLKHDDEIPCNPRLFSCVWFGLNIFAGSGKRGKLCRQELLFGMGWVFQYVFCNSYSTKHATTRTCWLRNLQICWVWSQTLRFWPESSPETPSRWCSFLTTLPKCRSTESGDVSEIEHGVMGRRWRAKVRTSGKPCLSILMWQMTVRRWLLPVYSGCKTEIFRVVHFGSFDLGRFTLGQLLWAVFPLMILFLPCQRRVSELSVIDSYNLFMTFASWCCWFSCFFPSKLPMLPGITALLAALRGIGWALVMAMSWGLKGLEVDSKKLSSKSPGLLALGCWFFSGTPGRESTPWMNFCCKFPKFVSGFLRASHPGTVASRVCLRGSESRMQLPKGGLAKAPFTNIDIIVLSYITCSYDMAYAMYHVSYIICHMSYNMSYVTYSISYVICHTYVICQYVIYQLI